MIPRRDSSTRTGRNGAMTRLHLFRLNARELLREPGLDKHVSVELPAAELGVDDDRITGDLTVDLHAVSTIDGITVHGMVALPWRAACRRCLAPVTGVTEIEIDEVYQDGGGDPDAFEIDGDQIDLAPAVREYVVLELPRRPALPRRVRRHLPRLWYRPQLGVV